MKNKPLIGLTCSIDYDKEFTFLKQGYYKAVQEAGAIAFLLPADEFGYENEIIDRLDGILLTGGPDIDPKFFGEESYTYNGGICPDRDKQEIALAKLAFEKGKPILGICRGIQVLNAAIGGTLYQDINTQIKEENILKHGQEAPRWYPSHEISISRDSLIYECFGKDTARVNSFHHQAVRDVAPGFKVTAHSSDGVIEAIEYTGNKFAVGVQWHPETMWQKDALYLEIFKAFVKECTLAK
jgi:putative glutamine amidotransferase